MKQVFISFIAIISVGVFAFQQSKKEGDNDIFYVSAFNSKGRDIYRMDKDGTNKKKLTYNTGRGHYPHHNNPKISPDGTKIVYQSDPDGHDRYTIWIMNIDGSNPRKITQEEGLYPNWSPDGKNLIFSGRRNGIWEILLVSSSGGDEEIISNNRKNGERPGWGATCSFHPDGRSIIFSYIREKVMYNLNLDSKEKVRLSPEGESYTHPAYSRDGLKIAVNRKKDVGYDLVIVSPNGKNEEVIAKNVISYSGPSWSALGKEILFTGMVNNNQEVFKINIETKQETQLTSNSDFDAMAIWR